MSFDSLYFEFSKIRKEQYRKLPNIEMKGTVHI